MEEIEACGTDACPSGDAENCSYHEDWLEERILCPEVAAYQAGRILVLLQWRLQQSLFGNFDAYSEDVRQLFGHLQGMSVWFSQPTEDGACEILRRIEDKWSSDFQSEGVALDEFEDWCSPFDDSDPVLDVTREQHACSMIERLVRPIVKQVRQAILHNATEKMRLAFDLGKVVEHGLCPNAYQKFIYVDPPMNVVDWTFPAMEKKTRGRKRRLPLATPSAFFERPRRVLVNAIPHPGEISPSYSWRPRLNAICGKLGFFDPAHATILNECKHFYDSNRNTLFEARWQNSASAQQFQKLVIKIDKICREGLSACEAVPPKQMVSSPTGTTLAAIGTSRPDEADSLETIGEWKLYRDRYERKRKPSPTKLDDLRRLRDSLCPEGSGRVAMSVRMLQLLDEIKRLNKRCTEPILILGPTGVGKSMWAKIIHQDSGRKHSLYRTSCALVEDNSLLSQWLGIGENSGLHDTKARQGVLQLLDGGTAFFDEL